jgi:excisionase family DNA binding protein
MRDLIHEPKDRSQHRLPCQTITVPEAGIRLGIGRNAAYEAARRGEIPVIRIGKRMVVPLLAFERMLSVESKSQIVATELVRRLQRGEPEAA